MNNLQISLLKRVLKKYGIKNAQTVVTNHLEFNYNKFLQCADSLYAIDRIASCYQNEREKNLLSQANKEWIGDIINNGWCSALVPYIEKYGAALVKKSIYYLIDNDMWDVHKGFSQLKTRKDNYYDGLKAINEAAEYLKEDIDEDSEYEEEVKKPEVEFVDDDEDENVTPEEKKEIDTFVNDVYLVTEELQKELSDCSTKVNGILNYIIATSDKARAAKMINDLIKKVKELEGCKEIADKLKKENEVLSAQNLEYAKNCKEDSSKVSCYKSEIERLQDLLATRNDEAADAVNEKNEIENQLLVAKKKLAQLQKDYAQAEEEIETLKEKASIPTKRVIPLSGLKELPLVGDKILIGLIPFLDKYKIYVDQTR